MHDLTAQFLERSQQYLRDDYLPKIAAAVERLSEEDLWWKPNQSSNSAANLLLHLAGNLRQWVVSSLGGEADRRQRDLEFSPVDRPTRAELLERLADAVNDAHRVIGTLDEDNLRRERMIQARTVTGLEALYHAVEHFSMHTGQILYIAKLRTEKDLGFYTMVDGQPKDVWRR